MRRDEEEKWAIIEDFPNYAVSTHGRVKNVKMGGRILKGTYDSYGNCRVHLVRGNEKHNKLVHRLMAKAFLPGFEEVYKIKHINKSNRQNQIQNLKLGQGRRTGVVRRDIEPPLFRKIRVVETEQVFMNVTSCARYFNCDKSTIYKVLRGDRESHLGLTFEWYIEGF